MLSSRDNFNDFAYLYHEAGISIFKISSISVLIRGSPVANNQGENTNPRQQTWRVVNERRLRRASQQRLTLARSEILVHAFQTILAT